MDNAKYDRMAAEYEKTLEIHYLALRQSTKAGKVSMDPGSFWTLLDKMRELVLANMSVLEDDFLELAERRMNDDTL